MNMIKNRLTPSFSVLIVDDEPAFIRSMSITLERSCGINNIQSCGDSRKVMGILEMQDIEIVLLDINMPHLSGEELLVQIKDRFPDILVIMISGMNQIGTAVKCVKFGAYEYFVKTTEQSRLVEGIKRAVQLQELKMENRAMRKYFFKDTLKYPEAFSEIITCSKTMRSVFCYLESIVASKQALLISGESGVGKELIVRALHKLSGGDIPLISANIAGLDDNVFSDTLFGHERGAFTGADKKRAGLVEHASGGILFLDEIGDLNLASQVKLLRLLQEGEYFSLGSDKIKRLNARIVVCTHKDLEEKQNSGEFRKDLYYRLRTHQVVIPPLRERQEDIPLLLDYFVEQAAQELDREKPKVPSDLTELLVNYSFPGNVRELRSMVFDAICVAQDGSLSTDRFKETFVQSESTNTHDGSFNSWQSTFTQNKILPSLSQAADLLVNEAMKRAIGNQTVASHLLGISQPALSKRMKNMKLREE